MRAWTLAAAALALAACTPPAPPPAEQPAAPAQINAPSGEYALDPYHTTVTARVLHFGLSHYVLRSNTVSGSLNFNAENPAQSSVQADVAVTSLDTPYGGPRNFDEELQNSEWLNAAQFPNATFRSTSVEATGPNTGRVTGDLTIRGVTHPLTLDVTYNASHARHPMGPAISLIGFSARGTISRAAYGLNVLQPSAPGASDGVADQVELLIEAEFTRPVEEAAPPARTPAEPVN